MKLQRGPSLWSCLPTSFAIVLDIPVKKILKDIGHDGGEIIWPELDEPLKRRGFHVQELIHVCYNRGYSVIEFQAIPGSIPGGYSGKVETFHFNKVDEVNKIISENVGVFHGFLKTGECHAVAWDGITGYDPGGFGITDPMNEMSVDIFWSIAPFLYKGVS